MDFIKSCNNYYVTSPNNKHLGQIMRDLEIAWEVSCLLSNGHRPRLYAVVYGRWLAAEPVQRNHAETGLKYKEHPKQQVTRWPGWEGFLGLGHADITALPMVRRGRDATNELKKSCSGDGRVNPTVPQAHSRWHTRHPRELEELCPHWGLRGCQAQTQQRLPRSPFKVTLWSL